jgi:hypothetical protein
MSAVVARETFSSRLPPPAFMALLGVLAFFSVGPNLDLCLLAILVLVVGAFLLWRGGDCSILLLTFLLHWTGASIAAFHANWLGIDIDQYSPYGGAMRSAVILSLLGILALAFGIRIGAGTWREKDAATARLIVARQPLARWFKLYAIVSSCSFLALSFAWVVPGLSQIFLAVASIKWAFFFMLAYASFAADLPLNPFFGIAFCVELATSIGGYFSDFKTVFLFSMFAALAAGLKFTLRLQALLGCLVVVLITFSIVWTEIKQEYRDFISDGEQEQVTKESYGQSIAKLAELVGELDGAKMLDGADRLLRRLTYVEFFSLTLDYVPQYLPHESGALLVDAITRPFMPRILFKDKAGIDDSARTELYTGGQVSASHGTSISIGYIAETYIDFGVVGMMVEILGLGFFYGLICRFFLRDERLGPLLGMALGSAVLIHVGLLESSLTKTIGSIAVSFLVALLLVRYASTLFGWATGQSAQRRRHA